MVRTSRNFEIIRKTKRQLLNERIGAISNTTEISTWERDTCINQLVNMLDQDTFKEWKTFISRVGEARQRSVRER